MDKLVVKALNTSNYPNLLRQSEGSSGFDLVANIKEALTLKPNQISLIPTGIYIEVPQGFEAQVRARSGLALKHGLSLVNGIGTIDADYRGEIGVIMINLSKEEYQIQPGERIAQLVFVPIVIPEIEFVSELEELEETDRGSGGFGHSGK